MEGGKDFSGLSQESDFNFDGFLARDSDGSGESDSGDASDVDSDVENAIFAELYFRDAKLKPNGSGKQKPVCFG
jgi:hypothetical protein